MATVTLCSPAPMQQSEAATFMAIETVGMQPAEIERKAGNTNKTAMPVTRGI